jgi:DNA-binding NtrC family response regulator
LTNQDLMTAIHEKRFREDLFYRLNVLSVHMPPLRDRQADIPILTRKLLADTCREMNIPAMEIDPSAMAWLARQPWPGNVRELLNYVRRLAVFSGGRPIDMALIRQVDDSLSPSGPPKKAPVSYKDAKKEAMDEFSQYYLTQMFEKTQGNISETARISGLERASIQKIIKRLGIDISRFRDS